MNIKMEEILKFAVANKASDVHLISDVSPKIRVNGELLNIAGFEKADKKEITEMVLSLLDEKQLEIFKTEKELDFSFDAAGGTRIRANVYLQKGEASAALRLISSKIPTFEELGIPDILKTFAKYKQGFVLVTGPTGHGKSTTVAAILEEINATRGGHIVTIEDPVEYLIKPEKAIISQREMGGDTNSFSLSLRSCLRQDPNVVFLGEMRDLESTSSALTIAETGHLVFSVLHTNSAAQTIDRIIDVFPSDAKDQIRVQLSTVITAIVSQRLVPAIDGGRIPVFEILIATPAVRNVIREGKSFMIDNIIQTSSDIGMISFDAYMAKLVLDGKVSEEVAMSYSTNPVELQSKLRRQKI
ncbi:MAG: type IV pilus twitching motility protein PilT [Candidatus Shapirobacteria bacterium]|nr:type IV pilus twitching motility protein PilT [Candidatus Shapirobacteria bacterium]MDD4410377.1 type IV pilus twitching motility protein PilT [Candidatus Shapirobacteria bacterium]